MRWALREQGSGRRRSCETGQRTCLHAGGRHTSQQPLAAAGHVALCGALSAHGSRRITELKNDLIGEMTLNIGDMTLFIGDMTLFIGDMTLFIGDMTLRPAVRPAAVLSVPVLVRPRPRPPAR